MAASAAREAMALREELAEFARRNGCEEIMARAMRECPRLRLAAEADRDAEMARRADRSATRNGRPWGEGDMARLLHDMRAGEPSWKTAMALGRTTKAVDQMRRRVERGERRP